MAIEHYRAALALWDLPAIHFNLAVALIELDRSREAYDHLQLAVAAGEAALGERLPEARNYLRLVAARLTTLEVECEAGAVCELDGGPLPTGPLLLEPGTHVVVGRRPGHATATRTVVLEPGERTELRLTLDKLRPRMVRRWRASRPWLVFGGGAAVAAAGVGLWALGRRDMDSANAAVDELCAPGCPGGLPRSVAEEADRARLEQRAGVATFTLGAASVIAGAVLLYLNQPRAELPTGPMVTPSSGGVVVGWGGRL